MKDTLHLLLIINITLYILHELDAISNGEWKILLGYRAITDEKAYLLFVSLHLPIIVLIAIYLENDITYYLVSSYVVIHFVIHLFDKKSWLRLRSNIYSNTLVIGNAISGIFNIMIDNL